MTGEKYEMKDSIERKQYICFSTPFIYTANQTCSSAVIINAGAFTADLSTNIFPRAKV